MQLFIVIKKKYFEQIRSGEKTEEYRLITPYWQRRLEGRQYTSVVFQAGYRSDSPRMRVDYLGVVKKTIKHEFFGKKPVQVYALKLGKVRKVDLNQENKNL